MASMCQAPGLLRLPTLMPTLPGRSVQLNGQLLAMVDDGTLPELRPRPLRAGRTLVIPPLTMSFYVVKNVNALACRYR